LANELGTVVAADQLGCVASSRDDLLERAEGVVGAYPAGGGGGECFAGVFVGDGEDLDRPAVCGLV
jgi:hypothetical protein